MVHVNILRELLATQPPGKRQFGPYLLLYPRA